nr:MAG TPA: hypothetical protein [Bacteriophage sp.]
MKKLLYLLTILALLPSYLPETTALFYLRPPK